LSTSVSSGRSKEIGIRKAFGAGNRQVKYQFLLEAVFLSTIVLPIAVLLMTLGISQAEKLFQTQLPIINDNIIYYLFIYLLLTILIGLISGLYTSVGLSRMNVIKVLKSGNFQAKRKNYFRASLIIFQLVIFCFFVASAFVIQAQYQLATKKNPGFTNKNILLVNFDDIKLYTPFLNEVRANSNVISASGAKEGLPMHGTMSFSALHQKNKEENVIVEAMAIDFQFLETMGIKLLKGRYLSTEFGSDREKSCIINETAIKALGIDEPIGCKLGNYDVVGVVKDFYPNSFHTEIPPLLIFISDRYLKQVVIRYKEGSLDDLLVALKKSWNKLETKQEFNSVMIEDVITELYSDEKNKFTIVSMVAFFTMLISSLGLFGLTLFLIRGKTKEIGIKKVLGCSERSIVLSFVKTNVIHVFIAAIISVPITIYAMDKWLSDYAVKTEIEWWFFAITFIIASLVVITTVFFHSYKAARLNPVKSLRYE
jgi:putative ABC transport system permease protein